MTHAFQPEAPALSGGVPLDRSAGLSLPELLQRTFGHSQFRPHQQPVCEAAASGRDVLLVMPTGAGKSLCYQLPALARGGTALVVSPLIALMDDQAHKLAALKLRVARIHSGLSREDLRDSARAYLQGRLDFLFIAPERLRVPGFPEMLAKRKPALVAIDEAHCISQWGHDFRPDYRTLGQFLPAMRPSPIIALTATATPTVQQDILRALDLQDPAVFITGFRRNNLHIEVVEASKPQRIELMRKLLAPESARPAIVYAQSRKAAEEVAGALNGRYSVAAYHAGLDGSTRERVQRSFLTGKLDVVVATVAFGMGIDKADVRTVIHAALPGSVEAYYQEIGRAGRDGQPSRAVLLHSFADRRTQEFLLEKSYPPLPYIERVLQSLQEGQTTHSGVQEKLQMEREMVEQSIDKLLVQGAVIADLDGSVRATASSDWRAKYQEQVQYRRAQIDKIVAFAEGATCRMSALIRHFGDMTDTGKPCSCCDICRPENVAASEAHQPNEKERADLQAILSLLAAGPRSSGKTFGELGWSDRKYFDLLTDDLARAGLLLITSDSFRSDDGREITYRKLSPTPEGKSCDDATLSSVWLRLGKTSPEAHRRSPSRTKDAASASKLSPEFKPPTEEEAALEGRLKAWRLAVARANEVPPFTILHDSVLRSIARYKPANVAQLEKVRGIGQEKSNRYGRDLLSLCSGREIEVPQPRDPQVKADPFPSAQGSHLPKRGNSTTSSSYSPVANPTRNARPGIEVVLTAAQQALEAKLRTWRSEQAAAAGLPSFFFLSDTALKQVVRSQPKTVDELGSIAGFGPDKIQRYGTALVELCHT